MLNKLFDTLAEMGIWIRFHDKRTEPPTEEGRTWGPTAGGFAISIAQTHDDSVSVLIKNTSDTEKRATIPAWLGYLQINVTAPDDSPVPLKPYGKQLLEATRNKKPIEREFLPGQYMAIEVPIGALYDLKRPGTYRVSLSCPVPGHPGSTVVSNEITLNVPAA